MMDGWMDGPKDGSVRVFFSVPGDDDARANATDERTRRRRGTTPGWGFTAGFVRRRETGLRFTDLKIISRNEIKSKSSNRRRVSRGWFNRAARAGSR